MLIAWMADNESSDWPIGLKFVQFYKNSAHHSGIKCSPYKALFGCEAKVGLASTSLPSDVINSISSEDDLLNVLPSVETENSEPNFEEPPESVSEVVPSSQEATEPATSSQAAAEPPLTVQETTDLVHSEIVPEEVEPEMSHCVTIRRTRQTVAANLEQQAERMVMRSRVELARGAENDNVAVPIPLVDRGRGDPRNILGIILSVDENDMYVIGTRAGVLAGKYSRNQFSLCPQPILKIEDMNRENVVSLREAVKFMSNFGGQGFTKCNCAGNCSSKRCKCFKSDLKCNSRCHNSLSCKNK